MESPAPTSFPTSAPVVETLLSKADGQLISTQTEDLTALLDEICDVFSDVPGRTTFGVHHIELKPDTKPVRYAPCRLNQEKAMVLKDELDNLFDQGIIEESTSPWASPIVMVPNGVFTRGDRGGDRSRDRSPRSVACMFTRCDRRDDRLV